MEKYKVTHDPADADSLFLRRQVAACTRLLVDLGIMNYSGHVSARTAAGDRFIIQSIDEPRSSLNPEGLLECDLNGTSVAPESLGRPPAEVYLHSEIYRARPDVHSIAHFHYDLCTAYTFVSERPLLLVKNHAIRWADGVPVHDDPSHVATPELGQRLAQTLGRHHAAQIRSHGQVITAEGVESVLHDAVHFVENAQALHSAYAIGQVIPLSLDDIKSFQSQFQRGRHVKKLWRYYVDKGETSGIIPREWRV
ncbi:class II aldolase/adducin family protein [Roseiarcaceae bacterium H3SJ34-1]|uniref:class II aldolase/adducin family protein n=1 Tax=Terripilifer ovatus TaxID=3032367 RepID=UPI003AB954D5|nr:class II aldolase/adducin family protein [Roseiarcaceae bacterium H3SJ34-1]